MKLIKVKTFRDFDENSIYSDSFIVWQKKHPTLKIIDTKIIATERTYVETELMVTYEEEYLV